MRAEVVRSDGEHRRKADRRVHGVASADPVPEPEHVGRIDAELRHFCRIRRDRDEVLGNRLLVTARPCSDQCASRMRIRHRFERRECLRRDDEERLGGIEITNRLGEVGAINVGDEPESHGPIAVVFQRFVGHDRSEVGAADADVDDIPNAFAGVPLPLPAPDAVGEIRHPVEHGVDLGHHVLAVDDDRCVLGCAQGDVQDGSVLRDVDLVSAEHGVDSRSQAAIPRPVR